MKYLTLVLVLVLNTALNQFASAADPIKIYGPLTNGSFAALYDDGVQILRPAGKKYEGYMDVEQVRAISRPQGTREEPKYLNTKFTVSIIQDLFLISMGDQIFISDGTETDGLSHQDFSQKSPPKPMKLLGSESSKSPITRFRVEGTIVSPPIELADGRILVTYHQESRMRDFLSFFGSEQKDLLSFSYYRLSQKQLSLESSFAVDEFKISALAKYQYAGPRTLSVRPQGGSLIEVGGKIFLLNTEGKENENGFLFEISKDPSNKKAGIAVPVDREHAIVNGLQKISNRYLVYLRTLDEIFTDRNSVFLYDVLSKQHQVLEAPPLTAPLPPPNYGYQRLPENKRTLLVLPNGKIYFQNEGTIFLFSQQNGQFVVENKIDLVSTIGTKSKVTSMAMLGDSVLSLVISSADLSPGDFDTNMPQGLVLVDAELKKVASLLETDHSFNPSLNDPGVLSLSGRAIYVSGGRNSKGIVKKDVPVDLLVCKDSLH